MFPYFESFIDTAIVTVVFFTIVAATFYIAYREQDHEITWGLFCAVSFFLTLIFSAISQFGLPEITYKTAGTGSRELDAKISLFYQSPTFIAIFIASLAILAYWIWREFVK